MSDDRRSDLVVWVVAGVVTVALCVVVVLVIGSRGADDTPASTAGPIDRAALYAQHCANCHGLDGSGGIGPQLNDGVVVERYPDIEDQIDVIVEGRNAMPPFDDALSDEEIRAIATYERTL